MPDLLTFAKGVNSGYVPLGGVAISDAIHATFAHRPYPGGLTYSGHPLACAAAVATIEAMEDDGVVEHAARLGDEVLGPGLRELAASHAWIGEVRGTGAFWADRAGRRTGRPRAAGALRCEQPGDGRDPRRVPERGLLPFANFNRIHVVPPLTITAEEAREGPRSSTPR